MKPDDEIEALVRALTACAVALGTKIEATRIAAVARLIDDIDTDAAIRAIGEHAKHARFFPTPAEIRERCGLSEEAQAVELWNAIELGSRSAASRRRLEEDPRVATCVRLLGGWNRLGSMNQFQIDSLRKGPFVAVSRRAVAEHPEGPALPAPERARRLSR